jgi:hypothetical protein
MDEQLAVAARLEPELAIGSRGPEPSVHRRELGKRSHPLLLRITAGTLGASIGQTSWDKMTLERECR